VIRARSAAPVGLAGAFALVAAFALIATTVIGLAVPASAAVGSATGPGGQTLTVSQVDGLEPGGAQVTVTGAGYNMEKGIYVAFCVVPAPGSLPTPCGGGADPTGGGLSGWISSNPPSYGKDLATPYGAGGTFSTQLSVSATIAAATGAVDCRIAACAVVTRNDHTRTDDRSQDVVVPVTFADATPAGTGAGGEPAASITAGTGGSVAPDGAATSGPINTGAAPPAPPSGTSLPDPIDISASDGMTVAAGADDTTGTGAPTPTQDNGNTAIWWIPGLAVLLLALAAGVWLARRNLARQRAGEDPLRLL
jgi:hypothetical protein